MANRFWTGTGTWNASNTANWGTVSGGTGASVPTASDIALFDANSTACTLGATVPCLLVNQTGFTGQLTGTGFTIQIAGTGGTVWLGATGCTNVGVTAELTGGGASATSINPGAITEANAVAFKVSSGTYLFTIANNGKVGDVDFTGFAGTWALTSRTIFGNLTLGAGMTVNAGASATIFATTGTKTITSNGVVMDVPLQINGVGGTVKLGDALAQATAARTLTLINGTFDMNGKGATIGTFALSAGTKTLTMGASTLTVLGNWDSATNATGFTVTAATGIIDMTSASTKTFNATAAQAFPTIRQGGAGQLSFASSVTANTLSNNTQPVTVQFAAGGTFAVTNFNLAGTAGNLVTIQSSSAGSAATLSKASGTVNASYLSIKDSSATGGAIWTAPFLQGNVNVSGNSGWIWSTVPLTAGLNTTFDIRSFTAKQRFAY